MSNIDKIRVGVVGLGHRGRWMFQLAMQEGFSTAPDNIRSLGFGAGMGLPNMKRYSDSISIDSEVGVGTTIVMTVNL